MKAKEILHKILLGMDAYLSCGVPDPYWELATELTREIYGDKGVALLESCHQTYDGAVDCRDEIILHTIHKWADPNTEVNPEELIEQLEALEI